MKTNKEIRQEAKEFIRGKWFRRIFTAGILLYFITVTVSLLITAAYVSMNVQTWQNFLEAKIRAMQGGLGYAVPSMDAFWQMTGASVFQQFIGYVFGAIVVFGLAGVMLKAVRNDDTRWLADSFGGFKRPLEVAWLMFVMNALVGLWSLLLFIPGIIAIYRYRQAWYLKSENPEWSALKCLAESIEMMRGHKWQAFCLDFFYLFELFMLVLACGGTCWLCGLFGDGSALMKAVAGVVSMLASLVFCGLLVVLLISLGMARTIFYRELGCNRARDMV